MSPAEFSFQLSVPNDPGSAAVIGAMARHAAEYAKLDAGAADSFVERAGAAAGKALTGPGTSSQLTFAAANGTLTMIIGDESVSQPLS